MIQVFAVYRVGCSADEIQAVSRDIALEQTVEVPESLVRSSPLFEEIVGRVEQIQPVPHAPEMFDVTIAYNAELVGDQLPQLLNLVYGNISMKRNIRLIDLQLPGELLSRFRGPNFGIEGIRTLLGVFGRPLLATALKPVGSANEEFARIAGQFALGGGDIVKDDHNLHDRSFEAFCDRVSRCHDAVRAANERTGRNTLYIPNLMAPAERLERSLEFLVQEGVPGVMVPPLLLGLDQVRRMAETCRLVVLAHPTATGAFFHDPRHGIDPGILLGTLFRLSGVDVSIFPNAGGRFTFSDAECREIGTRLRDPLGELKPAFPAPAGGMRLNNIPQMAEQYGSDVVCLIGGALLTHSESLEQSTRAFVEQIEKHFPARLVDPQPAGSFVSACELPGASSAGTIRRPETAATTMQHLAFSPDFSWNGREATVYKNSATLPFRDVARHELITGNREETAFDLRYFQIEPGGYSSLEKHRHTHTVICVRGAGTLLSGGRELPLQQFDVAYVPPLEVHQLRNDTNEPFGFFCIVDHDRDRPLPPDA